MAPLPKIEENPEQQARIRENLRAQTYDAALPAIEKGVDDAVSEVRDNKEGSFWGFLKSLIFKFAEMLGFEKTLAKWFGSPIPEKDEQKAVAAQVSDTVSQTLTDNDFTYTNKQEFEQGLKGRILDDLKANRANTPSFDDAQLELVAQRASTAASSKFASLFDENGNAITNPYQSPVTELAGQEFRNKLQADLDPESKRKLAMLGGKSELKDGDLEIISRVAAPTLADFEIRKDELKAQGAEAYTTVSDELRQVFQRNKDVIKNGSGLDMSSAGLNALADQIALKYVKENVGVEEVPAEFTAATEKTKRDAVKQTVQARLDSKLAVITPEGLKKGIDEGIHKQINDEFTTDPSKHSNEIPLIGIEIPGVRFAKATLNYLVSDDTAKAVDYVPGVSQKVPTDDERKKLADYMAPASKTIMREEIEGAFDRGDRALDKERIIKRLQDKFDAGLADGNIPTYWKEHRDAVLGSIRTETSAKLDSDMGELNNALAAASDKPAMPRLAIEGVAHDHTYDQPGGTTVVANNLQHAHPGELPKAPGATR